MSEKKFSSAEVAKSIEGLLEKKQPKSYYQSLMKALGEQPTFELISNLIRFSVFEEIDNYRSVAELADDKVEEMKAAEIEKLEKRLKELKGE
ncbi:hypothetical protein [Carboxylicivirga sp. RSCT41]|uniref:hypothetical protein n=1 Tax=Carboxylicivirga agarovorans TaxID=3417570 RepID=UPI003D350FFD